VYPSTIIGSFVFVGALTGGEPIRSTIDGLYHLADTSIRDAPSGYVLSRKCLMSDEAIIELPAVARPICNSFEMVVIPKEEAIEGVSEVVYRVYVILLIISVVVFALMNANRLLQVYRYGIPTTLGTDRFNHELKES